jgi:hypothetical protein
VGALVALAAAMLVGGGTATEIYARVSSGGGYLLDARLDESTLGRAVNIPAATWGEASFRRRSWFVLTSYAFTLRLRAEVTPGAARALRDFQVSARLPGRVVATNASRISSGTATWDALTTEPLILRTRAVHYLRAAGILLLIVVGVTRRRLNPR